MDVLSAEIQRKLRLVRSCGRIVGEGVTNAMAAVAARSS